MKKTVIAYWTIVVAAGIVAGVFAAHLEKYEAITGNLEKTKTLPFQRPATEAIECSKDMGKAAPELTAVVFSFNPYFPQIRPQI